MSRDINEPWTMQPPPGGPYTEAEIRALHGNPTWEAIWAVLKGYDVQRPGGDGYHGVTGDDVTAVYRSVIAAGSQEIAELRSERDSLQERATSLRYELDRANEENAELRARAERAEAALCKVNEATGPVPWRESSDWRDK